MTQESASSYNTQDILNKYKEHKLDVERDTIHYAALLGDIPDMEQHVNAGIQRGQPPSITLNKREKLLGRMPIHLACDSGNLEAVDYLIQKRVVDLDAGDFFSVTALHVACVEDHYEVVRMLLAARATVNRTDVQGDLPMHWAATSGHADIVDLLASHGSAVDTQNKAGWAPLHRAAFNGRSAAAAALIRLGAKLNPQNNDGNTPLHFACFMNHLDVMELLLSSGACGSSTNQRSQSCLDMCISAGARELLTRHLKLQRQAAKLQAAAAKLGRGQSGDADGPEAAYATPRRHRRSSEMGEDPGFPEAEAGAAFRFREHAVESSDFLDSCLSGYKQLLMVRAPLLSATAPPPFRLTQDGQGDAAPGSAPVSTTSSPTRAGMPGGLPFLLPASPGSSRSQSLASSRSTSFVGAVGGVRPQALAAGLSLLAAPDALGSPLFRSTTSLSGASPKWQQAGDKAPPPARPAAAARSSSSSGRTPAAAPGRQPKTSPSPSPGGSCPAAALQCSHRPRASAPGNGLQASGRTRSGEFASSMPPLVPDAPAPLASAPGPTRPHRAARVSAPGELLHTPPAQPTPPGRPSRLSIKRGDGPPSTGRLPDLDTSGTTPTSAGSQSSRSSLTSPHPQAAAATKLPKFTTPVLRSPSGSKLQAASGGPAAAAAPAAMFSPTTFGAGGGNGFGPGNCGRPVGRLVYMMMLSEQSATAANSLAHAPS